MGFFDKINNLEDNIKNPLQARIIMTVIIMSDCIYLWYSVKGIRKYLRTKDWRFFFPIVASLFAFLNNFNDILSFIFSEGSDCKMFLIIFQFTATLNWTPISWLQTIRLMSFTRVFYNKVTFRIITFINIALSLGYTISYYINLSNFSEDTIGNITDRFMFCSVKQNPVKDSDDSCYTKRVMFFDLFDSIFSLSVLVYTAYMALDNVKHLKFHHAKIKRMVEEGLIQLVVLTIAKITLYPFMIYLMKLKLMLVDIVWDLLSVIVVICAFRLVNVKYKKINVSDEDSDFI